MKRCDDAFLFFSCFWAPFCPAVRSGESNWYNGIHIIVWGGGGWQSEALDLDEIKGKEGNAVLGLKQRRLPAGEILAVRLIGVPRPWAMASLFGCSVVLFSPEHITRTLGHRMSDNYVWLRQAFHRACLGNCLHHGCIILTMPALCCSNWAAVPRRVYDETTNSASFGWNYWFCIFFKCRVYDT